MMPMTANDNRQQLCKDDDNEMQSTMKERFAASNHINATLPPLLRSFNQERPSLTPFQEPTRFCRYFNTTKGCYYGKTCRDKHRVESAEFRQEQQEKADKIYKDTVRRNKAADEYEAFTQASTASSSADQRTILRFETASACREIEEETEIEEEESSEPDFIQRLKEASPNRGELVGALGERRWHDVCALCGHRNSIP
jgi:hypothetical protein